MRRLEIIHLRSSGEPLDSLGRQIRESVMAEGKSGVEVTLYLRHGLDTDLAVHIRQTDVPHGQGPSRMALQLAAGLKAYGLVEHTLWEEAR